MWQPFHLRLLHFLHLLLFFPGEYKNSNLLYYIKSFKKFIENEENDRRSERNLCNSVKKPEKNSGLQRGLNP